MMQATITVVRAVGAEFVRRTLKPLALIGIIVALVLLAVGAWLTTVHVLWWIMEMLFIAATVAFVVVVLVARSLLRRIGSPLTKPQRMLVSNFVDKLERSVETVRTPYPVILFYIARDIIRPRPDAFVNTIAQDSRTLAPDFAALREALAKRQ